MNATMSAGRMAEIIYLEGCFRLVGVILNGYDVPIPPGEDAL
jgi:hypothetical protein